MMLFLRAQPYSPFSHDVALHRLWSITPSVSELNHFHHTAMKQLKTGFTPCDPLLELNHIHHSAMKQLYSTLGRLWLTTPSLSELNHIYHSTMSPA